MFFTVVLLVFSCLGGKPGHNVEYEKSEESVDPTEKNTKINAGESHNCVPRICVETSEDLGKMLDTTFHEDLQKEFIQSVTTR